MANLEEVSNYALDDERREKLFASQRVCAVCWTTTDGWPVGVFTQREALEARHQARKTPVDEVMNPAMLSLEADTPLHRAAAQAEALRVRRVIVVRNRQIEGILTGVDFARAAI